VAVLNDGCVGAAVTLIVGGVDTAVWPPQAASPSATSTRPARSMNDMQINLRELPECSLQV